MLTRRSRLFQQWQRELDPLLNMPIDFWDRQGRMRTGLLECATMISGNPILSIRCSDGRHLVSPMAIRDNNH